MEGSRLTQGLSTFTDDELEKLLIKIGFEQPQAACRCLRRINASSTHLLESALLTYLFLALSEASEPDRVLIGISRFLDSIMDSGEFYEHLVTNPRGIEILVKLFSGSQFLTEIILRHPEYYQILLNQTRLAAKKTPEQYAEEAWNVLEKEKSFEGQIEAIRKYHRFELLRIGACDLLDTFDMPSATRQLSHLAIGVVRACLRLVCTQQHLKEEDFVVLGMGKLGGKELNYSSDIDLLFLSLGEIANDLHTGELLIDALTRSASEGFLYRVDMRLRPWGQVGPLVTTPIAYSHYLIKHARLWEKQALLKARVIAGNIQAGNQFLRVAKTHIFNLPPEIVRSQVFGMKQLTESYLRQNKCGWGDVKLGEGSIRDIEFTTQYLQLVHGASTPDILHRNTMKALGKLFVHHIISADDYRKLVEGYTFLRTVEHHLQLMFYRQTHRLPSEPLALIKLAKRLGYNSECAGDQFLERYQQHCAAIRKVYLKYLGNADMNNTPIPPPFPESSPEIRRHLDRMGLSYSERFTQDEIFEHAKMANKLSSQRLAEVVAIPLENLLWQVTVVAYDFPGELSLICGLMFAHGLNIVKGDVFTYKQASQTIDNHRTDTRKKIVDVFTVSPVGGILIEEELWLGYHQLLTNLLNLVQAGKLKEAQMDLVKRVARRLRGLPSEHPESAIPVLYPIDVEIDNQLSDGYTVLYIEAQDTVGFLYELTTALAFNRIYIARVIIDSIGYRAHDIIYVSDHQGSKILDEEGLRKLRAATVLIKHFTHLLPFSPNPESALLHFRQFVANWFEKPDWLDDLSLLESPEVLHAMAKLLGVSNFLWDDFLRMQHENLFPVVRDVDKLRSAKTRLELEQELKEELSELLAENKRKGGFLSWQEALNAFKDREMFRVDMRHILGHTTEFWDFASELTDLVEVVVNAAYDQCLNELCQQYGRPNTKEGEPINMTVCSLGKSGGREIGFASDIELMFIYSDEGNTDGKQSIAASELFEKLVTAFVNAISARREGIFEIDLRLRPYGKAGSLSVSLDSFKRYFQPRGPAWAYERQALVKLRPIAGDFELGRTVVQLRDEYVYSGEPFDVTAMRAMRERQIRHLVSGGTFNLKYSPGGLTDIEYLVQALQIQHGKDFPGIRLANTREAMAALEQNGILSEEDYTRLRKAHTFLRWLIDSLRVVRGNAKDITLPPEDSDEFAYLTRRMNYGLDTHRLQSEITRYSSDVQEINTRLLG